MRELMVDFITSLDGYGAAEGWPGWWGLEGPEYLAWLGDQPEADYTLLMGANTYRLMSALASDGEPGTDALAGLLEDRLFDDPEGAAFVAETQLVNRDAVDPVREMKETGTTPMRTIGSSDPVPLAPQSRPRGPLSRGRLPGHHGEQRS